jgi:Protein of unknown function (DUF998)
VALIVAGVFAPDPINGYPAGTADTVSWHGIVHSMAPAVAGIAGLIAYVVFARRFAADRERGWLVWSVVAPVAVLTTNAVAIAAADFRVTLIGQMLGAVWATSVYIKLKLRRTFD